MNTLLLTLLLNASPCPPPAVEAPEIAWVHGDLDGALRQAEGLTMIYCWRDGSDYCAKFFGHTLADERVAEAFGGRPVVSANHGEAAGAEQIERYRVGTLPAVLFVDAEGVAQDVILGFIGPEGLIDEVARIDRGEGTLADLEARAAAAEGADGETFEERMALAGKLLDLGDYARHDAIVEGIRAADPKSRTVVGARAWLWKLQADLVPACECEAACACPEPDPQTFDLDAIYRHAKRVKPAEAKFEAYSELAMLEAKREDPGRAIQALAAADEHVPAERAMTFRRKSAMWMMQMPGERTSKERELALEFATAAFKAAQELEGERAQAQVVAEGASDAEQLLAGYRSTLAWALHQSGHGDKAEALMEMCVGQCPEGSFAEQLEKMREMQ